MPCSEPTTFNLSATVVERSYDEWSLHNMQQGGAQAISEIRLSFVEMKSRL